MKRILTSLVISWTATTAFSASIEEVVGALTGYAEISPGVRLGDRFAPTNREIVRTYLAGTLTSRGLAPERHVYRSSGENIAATLPATIDTDEYIVLGAHFDSVRGSPGANDNATGIAVLDDVLFRLTELPCRSRHILVAYFDEEERGLIGSRYFAQRLQQDDVNVHSVHTIDQMGWDRDGDRAVELELPTPALLTAYQVQADSLGIPIRVTRTDSTDHASFRALGYPAVGLTEEYVNGDTTPHYHRSTDKYETVDFAYMRSTSSLMAATIGALASEQCGP